MTGTRRLKAILILVAAVAFALSPLLSNDFGGFDPERFPIPQKDPPGQPAGYAFSIWGLIYAWLILHAGWSLLRQTEDSAWDTTRWPLLISLGVGTIWLPVALVSPLWAMALILVMLAGALMALFNAPLRDPWLGIAPLSIYAGWLTAASYVSIAVNAAGYGIGPNALAWAWVVTGLLIVTAGVIQWRLGRVPGYGLTVAWALVALGVANWNGHMILALAAFAAALVMATLPFLADRPQR